MTNEEAVKIIKSECYIVDLLSLDRTQMVNTALDIAVKALEQQSRDCKTCKHSDNGNCAGTEECHECMWESKYEQQPCEDCISRQAVLDIINFEDEWLFDANGHNANTKIAFSGLKSSVKDLPSVTPAYDLEEYSTKLWKLAYERGKAEQKWIPVSEKLPKKIDDVLVYDGVDMFVAWYSSEGEWNSTDNSLERDTPIIAWMPLPEPYKAESEDKE